MSGAVSCSVTDHADGLIDAGAGDDSVLCTETKRLSQDAADIPVKPCGACIEHILIDDDISKQFCVGDIDLCNASGQLIDAGSAQTKGAPGRVLYALSVVDHLCDRCGVLEVDSVEQREFGDDVLCDGVDDGLRECHVNVGDRLLGAVGLHSADHCLIELGLLSSQLTDAATGDDGAVNIFQSAVDLLGDHFAVKLRQIFERLLHRLLIIGGDGVGKCLNDFRSFALHHIKINHVFFSFI